MQMPANASLAGICMSGGALFEWLSELQHQAIKAQQVQLNLLPAAELPTQCGDNRWRKTTVIKWHLILVLATVTIQQAGGPFHVQLRLIEYVAVDFAPGKDVSALLTEGIAEEGRTGERTIGTLALHADQPHMLVLIAGMKMRSVR